MSTADWYARKFRSPQTELPQTPAEPVAFPVAQPAVAPPSASPTPKPKGEVCPHCHGTNFGKPNPQVAARCFDCGYVEGRDYHQETFAPSRVESTQSTKQMPTQQYAPQEIIGKIE